MSRASRSRRSTTATRVDSLILTDSGGVPEEAPALGKPVLVMRDKFGTTYDRILAETELLLHDADHYARMARGASPYGDGKAAARIADALLR